jgi:hypothetical protein
MWNPCGMKFNKKELTPDRTQADFTAWQMAQQKNERRRLTPYFAEAAT